MIFCYFLQSTTLEVFFFFFFFLSRDKDITEIDTLEINTVEILMGNSDSLTLISDFAQLLHSARVMSMRN